MKRSAEPEDTQKDNNTNEPKKIAFGLNKHDKKDASLSYKKKVSSNISIKLKNANKASTTPVPTIQSKVGKAALAFSQDDEDSEEEMPPEAKMRMKNIGRDTPTSSGPNSFGKSRMGFCDSKKMYEKKLKEIQDKLEEN